MRSFVITVVVCLRLLLYAAAQEPMTLDECQARMTKSEAASAKIDAWQKWYDENKSVPDRLNAEIQS
jgi:hypothetical protein